jgi:hypothetical protein
MRAVAEGLFRGMAAPAEVMDSLTVLDDIAMVIGDRDFPVDLQGAVLHAFDGNIHRSSLVGTM